MPTQQADWGAPAVPDVDDGFFVSSLSKGDTLGFYDAPSGSLGTADNWRPAEPSVSPFPGNPAVTTPPFPMQPPSSAPTAAPPLAPGVPLGIPLFGPAMPRLPLPTPHLGGTTPVYTLGFWKSLFDVDTKDVQGRILSALFLQPPEYLSAPTYGLVPQAEEAEGAAGHAVNRKPDFYGPLWIGATLWLVLVVISHTLNALRCASTVQKKSCTQSWFAPVAMGCSLVFGFELLVPVGLWLAMKWKDVPLPFLELVCLYGYSFTAFVPATMLWILPWTWLRWLASLLAFLLSSANIVRNLIRVWQQHLEPQWLLGAVGTVIGLQFFLTLALLLKFT